MERKFEYFSILSKNGHDISCMSAILPDDKKIAIMIHGFGGSMQGHTVSTVAPLLADNGIGVFAFDLIGHGSSGVSGEKLTVKACLKDIDSVYEHVTHENPQAEVTLIGTSFGGYLALLYNSIYERSVDKLIVRAGALNMLDIFTESILPVSTRALEINGSFTLPYDRPVTVSYELYKDLKKFSVENEFKPFNTKYRFIHGNADDIAPYYDVQEFCEERELELITIDGANHFFEEQAQECFNVIYEFIKG